MKRNKYVEYISAICLILLILSCSNENREMNKNIKPMLTGFEPYVDLESSDMRLETDEAQIHSSKETGTFRESDLMKAIQELTGTEDFETIQDDNEIWHVSNGYYAIKLYRDSSLIKVIILDEDIDDKNGMDTLDEDYYLNKSYGLMDSIGANRDELEKEITYLMAFNRDNEEDDEYEAFPVEKKYRFTRFLGGIQVASDFISIGFGMDGRLVSMVGRWTPINYSRSQLHSNLTEDQIVEKALERLTKENVDPNDNLRITLSTYYDSVKSSGEWLLDLKGVVWAKKAEEIECPRCGGQGGDFDI